MPDDALTGTPAGDRVQRIALLSHDLRSALSGIIGGLRQIRQDRLDADDRLQMERVMQESVILAGLLDTALQAEKSGGGAAREGRVWSDIAQFLTDQALRWRAQAMEKHIGWNLKLAMGLPRRLHAGDLVLTRIIGNVVNNAIKYTDSGTVELSAESNRNGGMDIVVTDCGPGFSQAALDLLFRIDGRPGDSAKPGTGMGLHISKSLLDEIGATIEVRNNSWVGAEIRMSFPAEICDFSPPEATGGKRSLPDLTGIRVLLAEDNKTNQMVATQMLQTMNAEVTVADDGIEALKKFENGNFDIALLDIEMPRMSGLDVLRAIRARTDARSRTPMVALTAYAMPEHKERITAVGANGLIPKPLVSIERFGHALLGFLGRDANAAAEKPVADQAAEGDAPEIDQATYDSLCASIGAESMGELLGKVSEDMASVRTGIAEAAAKGDFLGIRTNTHILISVAGAIGAKALQALAEALNAAAHGENNETVAEISRKCISSINQAEVFLEREQERYRHSP